MFKIVKKLHSLILAILFALCVDASAQKASPQAPVDSGAIVMPPATDPGAIKRPPANVDPKAIEPPPKSVNPGMVQPPPAGAHPAAAATRAEDQRRPARASQNENFGKASAKKKSKQDDCRGRADLCKQDSPR